MTLAKLTEILDKLVNSDIKSVDVDYIPMDEYNDVFEELGINLLDQFDSNGWDHDFWMYFDYKNTRMCFCGSWYYGGYCIRLD